MKGSPKTYLCTSSDDRHLVCTEMPEEKPRVRTQLRQAPARRLVSHGKHSKSSSSSSSSSSSHHSRHHSRRHDNNNNFPPQPQPDIVRHFTADITLIPVPAFNDDDTEPDFGSNDPGPAPFTIRGAMVNQVGRQVHLNVYDDLGRFFTTGSPAVFRFNLPVQTTIDQLSAGVAMFSSDDATASGDASVHPTTEIVGTASVAGTTVTGVGTSFDTSMIGGIITFGPQQRFTITAVDSVNQTLTLNRGATIPARAFSIAYSYGEVYLIGPNITPEEVENSQLTFDLHYII